MTDEPDIARIAEGLSELEAILVDGTATGWGSWMWMVSGDLKRKGLMYDRGAGDRQFTPLGKQVADYRRAYLERQP